MRFAIGTMHGRAEGGAVVRGGRLILNGTNAWAVTEPLPVNLREKTLEVWVALDGLDQKGGGALTVQTPDSEHFDSIVFGERETARWIAGLIHDLKARGLCDETFAALSPCPGPANVLIAKAIASGSATAPTFTPATTLLSISPRRTSHALKVS